MTGGAPLVAIIDTGDIVDNGKHADQFAMLHDILEPVRAWPYLVAVGNHELDIFVARGRGELTGLRDERRGSVEADAVPRAHVLN